jgi:hypothetical protein
MAHLLKLIILLCLQLALGAEKAPEPCDPRFVENVIESAVLRKSQKSWVSKPVEGLYASIPINDKFELQNFILSTKSEGGGALTNVFTGADSVVIDGISVKRWNAVIEENRELLKIRAEKFMASLKSNNPTIVRHAAVDIAAARVKNLLELEQKGNSNAFYNYVLALRSDPEFQGALAFLTYERMNLSATKQMLDLEKNGVEKVKTGIFKLFNDITFSLPEIWSPQTYKKTYANLKETEDALRLFVHPFLPRRVNTKFDEVAGAIPVGTVKRIVSADKTTLTLENAQLKYLAPQSMSIPSFVQIDGVVPLVPGKGIPTQTFITLHQMKREGVQYGSLKKISVPNIENLQTLLELRNDLMIRSWMEMNPTVPIPAALIEDAFLETHTGKYLETIALQSGHRIKRVRVTSSVIATLDGVSKRFGKKVLSDPPIQKLLTENDPGLSPKKIIVPTNISVEVELEAY